LYQAISVAKMVPLDNCAIGGFSVLSGVFHFRKRRKKFMTGIGLRSAGLQPVYFIPAIAIEAAILF
jgi:hypothetical protein